MEMDWVKPTEEETEAVAKEALLEALTAIGGLPGSEEDYQQSMMKKALAAFMAIHEVKIRRRKEVVLPEGKDFYGYDLDADHIVATAMMAVNNGKDGKDSHPYMRGTEWAPAYAKACAAIEMLSSLNSLFEGEGVTGGYLVEEIMDFVQKR